jgi:hypothetical protein
MGQAMLGHHCREVLRGEESVELDKQVVLI